MIKTKAAKLVDKPLTDLGVSEAGRPNLYTSRAHGDIFEHIGGRLDAADADQWDFHSFPRLPNEPEGDGLDGGPTQAPGRVPQTRFLSAEVHGQGRVGVGNGQCVSPLSFNRPGHKPNVRNQWRQLYP